MRPSTDQSVDEPAAWTPPATAAPSSPAAVLLHPHTHPAVTTALLVVSGLFGPLLTGDIRSRLPAIAGHSQQRQRRAQGWDVATYGISGTVGPTLVAAVSAWASLATATLALTADVPRPIRTLTGILTSGPWSRPPYFSNVVHGIDRHASAAGYSILLADTHDEHDTELKAVWL
ncbi:hypothetical protein [Streptomyces sp. NPDC006971]|uniref:hypothetical protein n=1 Tax=Streptomyces sp. NPDC006971 TaxID=3154784 RepID=UPI0033DF272B